MNFGGPGSFQRERQSRSSSPPWEEKVILTEDIAHPLVWTQDTEAMSRERNVAAHCYGILDLDLNGDWVAGGRDKQGSSFGGPTKALGPGIRAVGI